MWVLVLSDKEYFYAARDILKRYNYMSSKKLVSKVNDMLETNINAFTLARYITLYNDGSIRKKGKTSWEYVW